MQDEICADLKVKNSCRNCFNYKCKRHPSKGSFTSFYQCSFWMSKLSAIKQQIQKRSLEHGHENRPSDGNVRRRIIIKKRPTVLETSPKSETPQEYRTE